MISSKFRKRILFLSLIPSYLFLFGCNRNDLDAAEKFGLTSPSFQDATNKLSSDIYNSCIRKTEFFPLDDDKSRTLQQQEIDDCENLNKPTAQKAQTASQIISDYMTSIGELASTNVVSFDKSLKDIEDALTNLKIPIDNSKNSIQLNPSDVKTGINIVSLLLNWSKQIYQRQQLKTAIICTDEPFQEYSSALVKIFQDGYINGILKLEKNQVRNYYLDYITELSTQNGNIKDLVEIQQKYIADINSVSNKEDAGRSYISVIQKTASAHKQLKAIFSKGNTSTSSDEVKAKCKKYLTLQSKKEVVSKSLEDSQLSLEERKSVAKVASQYAQEVKPLLQKIERAF